MSDKPTVRIIIHCDYETGDYYYEPIDADADHPYAFYIDASRHALWDTTVRAWNRYQDQAGALYQQRAHQIDQQNEENPNE